MKKQPQSRIAKFFIRIFDIRKWFDWNRVKGYTFYLSNGISSLFKPQPEAQTESFEEAKNNLNLSDENILAQQKSLFRLSIIMMVLAFFILIYAVYQIFWGSIIAFLVSMVIALLALVLAFRYHFWYYQMKHHKLGCTFDEWFKQGILGEKK